MLICGKKVGLTSGTFLTLLIFMLTFLSYFWKRSIGEEREIDAKASWVKHHKHDCSGQLMTGTITPLEDKHSFIIAPYFDNRSKALIRVISIIHHEKVKELFCLFCCQNRNGSVVTVKADIDIHTDRFEFPYGTADLLCLEPQNCSAQYVSVHTSPEQNYVQLPFFEIRNRNVESPPREFTVCISTMFGDYNNVLQFVQSIEMYKILGAQKVVIYKNNCSKLMGKVLQYYVSEGIVEIIPWPINLHLTVSTYWHHSMDPKDIGYYGQIAALNDCIYHNMYRSKYVLLNDADEIIFPIKDADWKSLMHRLQEKNPGKGVFLFENHVFPNSVFAHTRPFNFSSWSSVPGVNIFQHIYKEPNKKGDFNNKKMIVDPRKVIQTSIHSVLKMYGEPVEVSSEIAFNYHCRKTERKDLPNELLIQDTILWRYNKTLIANINQVLHKCNILEADTQQ